MYDLLLKDGTVIDPSQRLNGIMDIAVQDGVIAKVASGIPEAEARRTINVKGNIVTAGLIDIHTHVLAGFTRLGADPDLVGVYAGVTTMADAGTAGCNSWAGFADYVLPKAQTEVYAYLNLGANGMITFPEIRGAEDIDVDRTIRVIDANRSWVKGVKIRMVDPMLSVLGLESCKQAVQIARDTGTRIMVHIGDHRGSYPHDYVRKMFDMLAPGDTVTHIWAGGHNTLLDKDGKVIQEAKDAQARGVWMDVGHGQGHVDFSIVQTITDQGILPQSISTDISRPGRVRTVHSMPEMMTRALALGFKLGDVIEWSTSGPAGALGEQDRIGSIQAGRQADISVLALRDGDWMLRDTSGNTLPATKAFLPVLTVKKGKEFCPEWGPRPWGWEPDSAKLPLPEIPAFADPRFD